MASLSLAIRRFRDGRVAVLGLVVLVLVTSICAALAPRLFDRFADDALRGEVAAATPFQRNIQLVEERAIQPAGEPDQMAEVAAEGDALERQMPAGLPPLFRDTSYLAETIRWAVLADTHDPGFVRLRVQQDVADHIKYVAGRPPTDATRTISATIPAAESGTGKDEQVKVTVLEVALSVATLERIGLHVGDTWLLKPDETDRLVGRGGQPEREAIDVVGSFNATDPDEEYWLDDTALIRPSIHRSGDRDLVWMTAVVAPQAYDQMVSAMGHYPMHYAWRYFTDVPRLESDQLASTVADLRRLDGTFSAANGPVVEGTLLQSGLLPLLESVQERWAAVASVLAVVGLGPVAVGIAALALVGVLVMERRRPSLALGRARGASSGQLIFEVLIEGFVIALPPAALATALAFLLLPSGPARLTVVAAVLVAVLTALILVVASAPTALAAPRGPGRDAAIVRRPSPRRLLFEAFVVVLAILGAYLLVERGVAGASSTATLTGVDPFIAHRAGAGRPRRGDHRGPAPAGPVAGRVEARRDAARPRPVPVAPPRHPRRLRRLRADRADGDRDDRDVRGGDARPPRAGLGGRRLGGGRGAVPRHRAVAAAGVLRPDEAARRRRGGRRVRGLVARPEPLPAAPVRRGRRAGLRAGDRRRDRERPPPAGDAPGRRSSRCPRSSRRR